MVIITLCTPTQGNGFCSSEHIDSHFINFYDFIESNFKITVFSSQQIANSSPTGKIWSVLSEFKVSYLFLYIFCYVLHAIESMLQ